MKFTIGLNEYLLKQKQKHENVDIDTSRLINGHMLIAGASGTGKSHLLRKIISSASMQNITLDVFDVHNDLNVSGSRSVLFSESTKIGFNPLELNPNPHSGGVRKRINEITKLINSTGFRMGARQESALRNMLLDVYLLSGIHPDNPNTWTRQPITTEIRSHLIKNGLLTHFSQYYPCLLDVISFCERRLKSLYLGADSHAVKALDSVNKLVLRIQKISSKNSNGIPTPEDELNKNIQALNKAKEEAICAYTEYVNAIETGREFSDVIKYTSKEVLQSVLERLQQLDHTGIFCPNPPDFGRTPIRNYQINYLNDDEKKLLIYIKAEHIFREMQDSGITDRLRRVIVIDESHKFMDDSQDNILNLIAKEGRKFGLALWCIAQSPGAFSEDYLSNVGTTILLPIHTMFWDTSCRKLRIDPKTLEYCKAREVAAIKLHMIGNHNPRFVNVMLQQD